MDVPTRLPSVMDLLAGGVPITLLADLAEAQRMSSLAILRAERPDTTWVPQQLERPGRATR